MKSHEFEQKEYYEDALGSPGSWAKHHQKSYKSCYHSHPALDLAGFKVYGGNCFTPVVLDADIYVGLQSGGMFTGLRPWERETPVIAVEFSIVDQRAPSSPKEFEKMVEWLCNQLHEGKKIHIGCIGGHGRTGTVLTAMAKVMMPELTAPIEYVRQNYCKKAVESSEQVKFLMKYYGAENASVKEPLSHTSYGGGYPTSSPHKTNQVSVKKTPPVQESKNIKFSNALRQITPVPSPRNIFAYGK